MLDRFLYYLYRLFGIVPKSLKNKALVVKYMKINPYSYNIKVIVSNRDITESIKKLSRVISIDYDNEYSILPNDIVRSERVIYLHRWYSYKNTTIDNSIFIEWLRLVSLVSVLYNTGLTKDPGTKAYINSIKLKPMISEAESILNRILNV
jgi:hypothetical protein